MQVFCFFSFVHGVNILLCIVYLPGSTGTSVEELILITYLWGYASGQKWPFRGSAEWNHLCRHAAYAREMDEDKERSRADKSAILDINSRKAHQYL